MVAVEIRWCRVAEVGPERLAVLDRTEQERYAAYARPVDRQRFAIGALLLREVAAQRLGVAAGSVGVQRRCTTCAGPHGRPTIPGSGLEVSVTHAGSLVGVAVSAGVPVGLDVEPLGAVDPDGLVAAAWSADEQRPATRIELIKVWTRKEAVVKATGEGLAVGLRNVVVAAGGQPPAVHTYAGRRLTCGLHDLTPAPGHLGALCALTGDIVRLRHTTGLPRVTG